MDSSAIHSDTPPRQAPNPRKVSAACQRCRRQKIKCDIQRPCTLCVRAGVECSAPRPDNWRVHGPSVIAARTRRGEGNERRGSKRVRQVAPPEDRPRSVPGSEQLPTAPTRPSVALRGAEASRCTSPVPDTAWNSSSAAMTFVEEAFQHHDTTSPNGPDTSAFTARQWKRARTQGNVGRKASRLGGLSSIEMEFWSILPQLRVATLLVDNYFERIHWFMLVFHQDYFRQKFRELYAVQGHDSADNRPGVGFLSVFLAVCLVSLRYTGDDQRRVLTEYGVDSADLQERLLNTLRLRLLDIVSLGSIEAVQTCVLLGSFYLYHGAPELAWPICGCGLRIAQALNLHRRIRSRSHESQVPNLEDPAQQAEETRKRCWWAVYEIETFCSMLYGFPLSISDSDCDIELLNPYALRSQDSPWNLEERVGAGQATLLSYKRSMVELSIIVKSALVDLYGLHGKNSDGNVGGAESGSRLHTLIQKVTALDRRLHSWYQSLPKVLQSDEKLESWSEQSPMAASKEATGFPDQILQLHLFQLQRLALKLSFENARILIHRPLLSYRTMSNPNSSHRPPNPRQPQTSNPIQSSLQACRDAALQISRVGSMPIVKEAADTYAVSFISLHLFTAGVTLSIMASLQPLSSESQESKMGLRRLMEMQARLKSKSIVAEQGFEILKNLMRLVMKKETDRMLEFESQEDGHVVAVTDFSATTEEENISSDEGQVLANTVQNRPDGQPSRTDDGFLPLGQGFEPSMSVEASFTTQLDFYEDPLMSQALLDFEQVLNYIPNENVEPGESDLISEYLTESCFSTQDQGWIWGIK